MEISAVINQLIIKAKEMSKGQTKKQGNTSELNGKSTLTMTSKQPCLAEGTRRHPRALPSEGQRTVKAASPREKRADNDE